MTFGLAILFSCAYHWKLQLKKAKILTNAGRIFWSLVVMRALLVILVILAFVGMPSSA